MEVQAQVEPSVPGLSVPPLVVSRARSVDQEDRLLATPGWTTLAPSMVKALTGAHWVPCSWATTRPVVGGVSGSACQPAHWGVLSGRTPETASSRARWREVLSGLVLHHCRLVASSGPVAQLQATRPERLRLVEPSE